MSRFLCSFLIYLTFAAASYSFAQNAKPSTTAPAKPVHPKQKLTPEQQRGLRLLTAAEAQAAGLAPAMQAAVLWQVAHGYEKFNRTRVLKILASAFKTATTIDDDYSGLRCYGIPDHCHAKPWLEWETLHDLLRLSPSRAEELLPSAEQAIQQWMTSALISKYSHDKKLDHAEELLHRLAQEQANFPYDAASDLMLALPPQREQDKVVIFNEAVANFRTYNFSPVDTEDLGTLIIRFWQHLPTASVLEAIDMMLGDAKQRDENAQAIAFSTPNGSVSLSQYEYRVFEFLPVLQHLDPARAERLQTEHQQVTDSLNRYPNGLASLYPLYRDTPPTEKEERSAEYPTLYHGRSAADHAESIAADRIQRQLEQQTARAAELARRDPKQALAVAMTVPLHDPVSNNGYSPRASTLADIAPIMAHGDPDTAKSALKELRSVMAQLDLQSRSMITRIIETYLNLGDRDAAEKTLDEAMKFAAEAYENDSDASDPNLAPKALWPSTAMWRKLITLGHRLSPDYAEKLITEIPDEEIQAVERVALATALLGGSSPRLVALEWHKGERRERYINF